MIYVIGFVDCLRHSPANLWWGFNPRTKYFRAHADPPRRQVLESEEFSWGWSPAAEEETVEEEEILDTGESLPPARRRVETIDP